MENSQQKEMDKIVLSEKPDVNFKALDGNLVRVISKDDETYLDNKYDEMLDFMRNKHSQSYTPEEKDDLYHQLQLMWNEVSGKNGGKLNNTSFNLILHKDEFKFTFELLKNKIEYDVDTIFYGIELKDMLADMNKKSDYDSDEQAIAYNMTPVDIHYLYHLLSKQSFKGLNKSTYTFAEVIKRIALSSNVFNHYKSKYEDLAKAIQIWVQSLDKGVTINESDKVYQMIWGDSDVKPSFAKEETVESK